MIGAFTGSATGISVTVAAVDATASTFRGVVRNVSALKAQVSGFGGSLAFFAKIGAAVGSLAIVAKKAAESFRELSELTDRAADAGTSAPALQKLVGAMQQLGVRGASIDTVSRAMQNMARTTGEVGAEGFAKVLGQAARMGSEAERLDFLTQAFGRSQGAVFAAMIRDGDAGVQKLIDLAAGYPAVSDAAAQAGDRAADAMSRASGAIKAGWGEMCAQVVFWIESTWGPLPQVAQKISTGILYAFKGVTDSIRFIVLSVRSVLEPIVRTITWIVQSASMLTQAATDSGYSFRDAFRDIGDAAKDHVRDFVDGWNESAEGLFDFSNIGATTETSGVFDDMRRATKQGGVSFRNEATKAIADTASAISNAFSKGGSFALKGSNEAAKIIRGSATGSAAQSQRTVTQFLPRIAEGIERTVSGIGDMVSTFDDLEVI